MLHCVGCVNSYRLVTITLSAISRSDSDFPGLLDSAVKFLSNVVPTYQSARCDIPHDCNLNIAFVLRKFPVLKAFCVRHSQNEHILGRCQSASVRFCETAQQMPEVLSITNVHFRVCRIYVWFESFRYRASIL